MSRAQLTSTVEQNTGGAVSPYVAGKNKIINGDFGIWQRGTSFTNPASGAYNTDRFICEYDGTGGTKIISQQTFTPGTAPVAGYESTYFLRMNQSVAGTGATFNIISTKIEDVRTFAGQTITLSFWVKAGTASGGVTPSIHRNYGSGGSATDYNVVSFTNVNFTTGWVRYSGTVTMPSVTGKTIGAGSYIQLNFPLPINTVITVDFWGLQLEAGSVATPFTTATGTLSGELQACQRYYYQLSASFASDPYTYFSGNGYAATTTIARAFIPLPVSMRTTPSLATNTLGMRQISNDTLYTSGTFSLAASYPWVGIVAYTHGSAVFTTGNACILTANNSTAAYVALSAEL